MQLAELDRGLGEDATADDVLARMWEAQGFTGFPTVGPPEVVDQVVAQGGVELWRGLGGTQAPVFADQFRTGDPFPGLGVFGSGTYTAVRRDTGEAFATPAGQQGNGALMRMALLPDARVIDKSELDAQFSQQLRAVREAEGVKFGYLNTGSKRALFADPGRFATAMGYDAIRVDRSTPEKAGAAFSMGLGGDDSYYVVLNRSALAVQDTDPRVG